MLVDGTAHNIRDMLTPNTSLWNKKQFAVYASNWPANSFQWNRFHEHPFLTTLEQKNRCIKLFISDRECAYQNDLRHWLNGEGNFDPSEI